MDETLQPLTKVEIVQSLIRDKIDQYIIDSQTGFYNEVFLKELLIYEIEEIKTKKLFSESLFLLYFNIDNLTEINSKYNTEIGDETILNIGYLITHMKNAEDILIKRNGPGYILYIRNDLSYNIGKYASAIQNEIKKAQVFVEAVSVSIAMTSLKEVDLANTTEINVANLFSKGNKRVNVVPTMGPNAYLDTDILKKNQFFGKVLLITSDTLAEKMFTQFFLHSGVEVLVANDPFIGIDIAYKTTVDAIICEKTMPKMDGFTLKDKLNNNAFTMNTLFILLSNYKSVETILRSNELRIDYVTSRPLIFEEILGFIQREIKKRGTRL